MVAVSSAVNSLPFRTLAVSPSSNRDRVVQFLSRAGIDVGGSKPGDIVVHDDRFFDRFAAGGTLALGEAYVDGWWDCDALDVFFHRLALVERPRVVGVTRMLFRARAKLLNLQSRARATHVTEHHYDLGNAFYERMLDPYMQYSCGYWDGVDTLEEAQVAKLDLVCRKLHLKPGDHVLDIGCGWGGLARYMAQTYGCRVTAVNISKEQLAYARASCRGLPVEILERDYREVTGSYDKVSSVGLMEAVGQKNHREFFDVVHRVLKPEGTFVLHTIGDNVSRVHSDAWIEKYIFPNGYLPSIEQIARASERRFVIEDLHNIGPDYDRTLMAWTERFDANWEEIKKLDSQFDERFRRMWRYYLLYCAGGYRGREVNLWQFVMTRHRSGTVWDRIARR